MELDPNSIIVHLKDKTTPIVILFGPHSCGKTIMTFRLAHWLMGQGYYVESDRNFRLCNEFYKKACDLFEEVVHGDFDYVEGAQMIHFMLVRVMNKYGEPICQILEAPGQHYFDYTYPNHEFPMYINELCTADNPKIWMFIVERNWKDAKDRLNYANKIIKMQSLIKPSDRVIFTCHKSDLHPALIYAGKPKPDVPQFFKDIKDQYPGIFSKYENKNPISRLWRKYNFDFVVFSAGTFNPTADGGQRYNPSKERNPASLWKAITKNLKK